MKLAGFVITVVVVGLSGPAFAQGGNSQQAAANPPANQGAAAIANTPSGDTHSWMASGFLGTNFGASRNNSGLSDIEDLNTNNSTSANYGFQIGYLGRGVVGGEFLADFSPGLDTFSNVLFTKAPGVNSYMLNLITAAPFGHAHSYDPYFSGGVGAVSLHSTIFTVDPRLNPLDTANIDTERASATRFGWNLGGGVMAWSEKSWGFRGDIRYYKSRGDDTAVFDTNNIGNGTEFAKLALAGTSFWKANMGIAFRW
jgi:hypothetical protein